MNYKELKLFTAFFVVLATAMVLVSVQKVKTCSGLGVDEVAAGAGPVQEGEVVDAEDLGPDPGIF